MCKIAVIALSLATIAFAVLMMLEARSNDNLRAELRIERDKRLSHLEDNVATFQLVKKYQDYFKEKGIPLP
jgi:hypothetical protein